MYQTFIGLEIHIHLLTKTKVFCSCPNEYGSEPNTNICPVCTGYPGVLPSLNEEAVRKSYQVCTALNCHLNETAVFERKNYFYPDMPKNYQISQFEFPFGINGYFDVDLGDGNIKRVRIHDVHLEEDAGKMIHSGNRSYLDYNRAGTPLLEIVTEPDLESGREAELFLQQFQQMVRYLGVSDGNMEEGSLRCDANVSINEKGKGLGTKTEVKNLNSSRFVNKALEYEIRRHRKVLKSGEKIIQETRLWDEERSATSSMRTKESSNDYRYFPEPDLPPYRPDSDFLKEIKDTLPELPLTRKKRFMEEYSLSEQNASAMTSDRLTADLFEGTVGLGASAKQASSWISGDVRKQINATGKGLEDSFLTPGKLYAIIEMVEKGTISRDAGKKVLEAVFSKDTEPAEVVRGLGLEQVSDTGELEKIVGNIVDSNPKVVQAIRDGADKQIGFLMGQVMKATSGKANPKVARQLIENKIFKQG